MLHTPPLTQNQKTTISSLHIKDWNTAVIAFAGLTKEQIFTQLVEMDPSGDNMELMELIFREMPRYLDTFQVAKITGLAPRHSAVTFPRPSETTGLLHRKIHFAS